MHRNSWFVHRSYRLSVRYKGRDRTNSSSKNIIFKLLDITKIRDQVSYVSLAMLLANSTICVLKHVFYCLLSSFWLCFCPRMSFWMGRNYLLPEASYLLPQIWIELPNLFINHKLRILSSTTLEDEENANGPSFSLHSFIRFLGWWKQEEENHYVAIKWMPQKTTTC